MVENQARELSSDRSHSIYSRRSTKGKRSRVPSATVPVIEERAQDRLDLIALKTPGKVDTTYGDLLERIGEAVQTLARAGIARGSRVGLVVPQRDAMAAVYLAVISIATAAPFSPNTTPDELDFYSTDFRLDAIIVQSGMTEVRDRAASLGLCVITLEPDRRQAGGFSLTCEAVSPVADLDFAHPDDVAVLFHTSGTTSRPKVVPRTHTFQLRKLLNYHGDHALRPGDMVINAMPLHHTQGLGAELLTPLLWGASVVMIEFDPTAFVNHLETYRPTRFTLVPSMQQMVIDTISEDRELPLDVGLRFIDTSSAKLTTALRRRMEKIFGVPIVEHYGATEVDNLVEVSLSRNGVPEKSVGRRSHEGVVIMDEAGNVLSQGEVGEICVNTGHTIAGYENNPEANATSFREHHYRTGDAGYLDENDFLFVLGRISETINRGGEKISPYEIEEVLARHPDVAESAVFGVPDVRLGSEVWAAVVLRTGAKLNANEIRAFAAHSLSFPKVPKRVIPVQCLPLNQMGKVSRAELSQTFSERAG